MKISQDDQQKLKFLMEELCQLFREALAKEASGQLEAKLAELIGDFHPIRKSMDRQTGFLEVLLPRADAMGEVLNIQMKILATLDRQASAISSIQRQLGLPAIDEGT